MARFLIATHGSFGDVYPLVDIGVVLQKAGNEVRVASHASYAQRCESRGLQFLPTSAGDYVTMINYQNSKLDQIEDTVSIFDQLNFQDMEESFELLCAAANGASAIVAPVHLVAAHLVAEKWGIPLLSCLISPALLAQSTHVGGAQMPAWNDALDRLRRRYGLEHLPVPMSAMRTGVAAFLGLFPRFLLEAPVGDALNVTGLPQLGDAADDPELRAFADERTVVFSFGSYMDACDPVRFFTESVAACRELGLKCIYLSQYVNESAHVAGADVLVRSFVPHDAVFPHAAVVVHHGGMGTLYAACKYHRPMVVVPFLHDQPFNAGRLHALIGAPVIPALEYSRDTIAAALRTVLANAVTTSDRLARLMVGEEGGAERAAQAILAAASGHRAR